MLECLFWRYFYIDYDIMALLIGENTELMINMSSSKYKYLLSKS